jgi:hypothetical protein
MAVSSDLLNALSGPRQRSQPDEASALAIGGAESQPPQSARYRYDNTWMLSRWFSRESDNDTSFWARL